MVATKENAFFVFVAILAILAANRFGRFGTVSRPLLVLTVRRAGDRRGDSDQRRRRAGDG